MSNPIFCPVVMRALVWAEKTTVFDPGTPHEIISTKRSQETFCLAGSNPEELMDALLKCRNLKSPDQLFIKRSTLK